MLLPTSQVRRPISIAPVAAAISAKSSGATKWASGRPPPQSIRWPGAAMKPSSDIALFTTTLPFAVQEWPEQMSEPSTANGKVVVNRAMSLDGFIAAPGHRMDWGGGRPLAHFVAPEDFAEIAAATGAMLIGRRTWDVGSSMEAEDPGSVDYPFSG